MDESISLVVRDIHTYVEFNEAGIITIIFETQNLQATAVVAHLQNHVELHKPFLLNGLTYVQAFCPPRKAWGLLTIILNLLQHREDNA